MPPREKGFRSLPRRVAALAVNRQRWPEIIVGVVLLPYRMVRRLFNRVYVYGSYYRSVVRRRQDFVEERWSGLQDVSAASRIAVFNHYDRDGVVHDFAAHYLRQLAEAGFTVIFVSNAPRLSRETVDRLRPSCALILRRANVGYDFGALKDGIAQIPSLERVEALLLVNDSVYGPFHPLKDIVSRMDRSADVWGITDSWQHQFHLQSFFLLFGRTAVTSPAFAQFWSNVRYVQSKEWIIEKYEIGLTGALVAGGLSCRALYPYREAAAAFLEAVEGRDLLRDPGRHPAERAFLVKAHAAIDSGAALNSTHYFWDYLIERMGCPFLKRELLRENPEGIPYVRQWDRVVAAASAYDTGLVERHLTSTMCGREISDPLPAGWPRRPWYE